MAQTVVDDYAARAFAFYEKIASITDPDAIRGAIVEAINDFGFEYLTCADIPTPGEDAMAGVLLNNRPEEYVARYVSQNYTAIDPVVTELRQTLRPYSWGDVRERRGLSKLERTIMDEAREFSVRDGFIVPILSFTGSLAIFSPCGRDPDLSPRARAAVEMIAAAGHQALKRAVVGKAREDHQAERLTNREREILQWVALGKSNSVIGEILGISELTVVRHVHNLMRKLDAGARTVAVVKALRRGEISI